MTTDDHRSSKVVLRNIGKTFWRPRNMPLRVLHCLSLAVRGGSFTCFVGPSGCGKTTLLRLIAGLEGSTEGDILIDGQVVTKPRPNVGMVFQSYSCFPWLTVRKNVQFGLTLNNHLRGSGQDELVDQMLDLVGLRDFERAYPDTLSGGMRQRVALARALVVNPSLLLLDEPFGALDAQTRTLLQDQLNDLWDRLNTTVCLVTHDVEEALVLSDTIHVLSARPASIMKTIQNPLPHPRPGTIRADKAFIELRMEILASIQQAAREAMIRTDNDYSRDK